jgi:hypothetical protein
VLEPAGKLLASAPVEDAAQFVAANSHPRLWRALAEEALRRGRYTIAQRAFARCRDYHVTATLLQSRTLAWSHNSGGYYPLLYFVCHFGI